jgi:hypothetical protein
MYIALRSFRSIDASGKSRFVKPGEEVPEAKTWKNTSKYVERGWITDADGMVTSDWAKHATVLANVKVRSRDGTPAGLRTQLRMKVRARVREQARSHARENTKKRPEAMAPVWTPEGEKVQTYVAKLEPNSEEQLQQLTEDEAHEKTNQLLRKLEEVDLNTMNRPELVEMARVYGVDCRGTKRELRDALLERKTADVSA